MRQLSMRAAASAIVWSLAVVGAVLAVFVHAAFIQGYFSSDYVRWGWVFVDLMLAGLPLLLALAVSAVVGRTSDGASLPAGTALLLGSIISLACAVYWNPLDDLMNAGSLKTSAAVAPTER